MNLLAAAGRGRLVGAPRRGEVVDARLRLGRQRPEHVPRGHAADQPGQEQRRALPGRGRGARPRLRRGQPGDAWSPSSASPTSSAPTSSPPSAATCRGRCARPSSASTRSCSSSRRTTSSARCSHVTRERHPRPLQRGRRRAAALERGGRHLRHPARPPLPVQPASRSGPLARLFDFPPELEDLLRYGRGVDTRRFGRDGLHLPPPAPARCARFIRAVRLRRQSGRTPMSYTYEHDVEQFFRHSPSVRAAPATAERSDSPSHSATRLGSADRPLLGGDGVAHVVLPDAVDLEVALRRRPPRGCRASRPPVGWRRSAG